MLPRRDPTDGKPTPDSILYQQGTQGQASTGVDFLPLNNYMTQTLLTMASEQHALWKVTTMEELGRMIQLLLREVLDGQAM